MRKRHWLRNGNMACPTKQTSDSRLYDISAKTFRADSLINPDWFCVTCTKAARIALAAESAPKPLDAVWPKPRPISEAPKDGSMVLICLPASKPQWTMGVFARTHWVDLCLATAIVEPTHFLPLPPEVK